MNTGFNRNNMDCKESASQGFEYEVKGESTGLIKIAYLNMLFDFESGIPAF